MKPHVALFLPTLESGGAERAFVELANVFTELGIRVDFVLADGLGPYSSELSEAVRLIDFRTRRRVVTLVQLVRYLRKERPNALLTGLEISNAGAIVANGIAGTRTRCVVSQRAVMRPVWRTERPFTWRMWLTLFRKTYSRAPAVICNSKAAYDEMIEMGIDESKCAVIYNAVDVERIATLASESIDDPWITSGTPLIISVGSLTPRKDMVTLLRAFAIVRAARTCNLLILGEGPEHESLRVLARELGVAESVRLPGFMANPFPWIARARVLVSASRAEGCPNVIQQALACGTPVVATDCPGGTAEILENGRWGRLVPMGDPQAMASAINATLDDAKPNDGRLRAADFDAQRTAEQYLGLLLPDRQPHARTAVLR